jgi:hypothetical protein
MGNIYLKSQEIATFATELFDSIAPQNAEIRTVTKSLLLFFKNSANDVFFS